MDRTARALWILGALVATAAGSLGCKGPPPTNPGAVSREPNRLLWGDTHVHTSRSADASRHGARAADLNAAYDWAKGLPVVHPTTRARIQLRRPLDFLVVTDHAEGLQKRAWSDTIDAAERHYAPCAFTTFIGWEWSSELADHQIHRSVFMNQGAMQARELLPFSALDGTRPEDLWSWLQEKSSLVVTDFIAIPHAPNLSAGTMYPEVDAEGAPITAEYAEMRMRWEPVSEVTQVKGDSETHPALSPDDEFADFETYPATQTQAKPAREGAYARTALLRGLQIGKSAGANPFQFAMIGSTGSHTGLASADEDYFWGARPGERDLSAQGLTAVWAEENTRTSIFNAFKRKEVYATTGPRIRVRFFGGWSFTAKHAQKASMVMLGYTEGHPMGSELTGAPEDTAPTFMMYALKDPEGANLDRIQIVKGWVDDDGQTHEKVYDVVWSGGRERGPDGTLTPVTNLVHRSTATYLDVEGAPSLHGFWSDPQFDPEQPAFYYLRVLQVPTPRHTLYDALAEGTDPEESGHPVMIQERAYTSPIWYTP